MIRKNFLSRMALAVLCMAVFGQIGLDAKAKWQKWDKGPQWLENAVIYQVYPSSFQDSDGDGIGDIQGVLDRLDYIYELGVDVLWFNPLFESGWIDGGYDVIDYYKVDKRFGTNADLVRLIEACHARGMKLMLDLVPGHTSMEHPWFKQSMEADPYQRYSNYYIWSDTLPDAKAKSDLAKMLTSKQPFQDTRGKWMLASKVPGAERAKYYMKNFYACQPSLNFGYANPDPNHPWEQGMDEPGPRAVLQEMKNILAFWYGLGVDGFRVDMASSLVKNDPDKKGIKALWRDVRVWMDRNYPERVLMAEWNNPKNCLSAGFNVDMYLNNQRSTNRYMYFDYKHQADGGSYFSLSGGEPSQKDLYGNPWPEEQITKDMTPAKMLKTYYDHYQKQTSNTSELGFYATITGNHDHLRLNTGARNDATQLKVMMAWVMTMNLPILYYGDEIGLRSLVELPNVEGANHNGKERAGARTPMQWDGSATAGFSTCDPSKLYLPVCVEWTPATSYPQYLQWKAAGCPKPTSKGQITVESQENDPASLLNWTKKLISLRKETPAFWASAQWTPIFNEEQPYPMVYVRSNGEQSYLVALNPTGVNRSVNVGHLCEGVRKGNVPAVMSVGKVKYNADAAKGDVVTLGPTAVMIVKIK